MDLANVQSIKRNLNLYKYYSLYSCCNLQIKEVRIKFSVTQRLEHLCDPQPMRRRVWKAGVSAVFGALFLVNGKLLRNFIV